MPCRARCSGTCAIGAFALAGGPGLDPVCRPEPDVGHQACRKRPVPALHALRYGPGQPGSEPQEHGVEPDQAQCLAVELPHLAEHVGLLDPLNDLAVFDPDVVEEAGLE
jgi:hypothetical protein